jgi:hypothetical protein
VAVAAVLAFMVAVVVVVVDYATLMGLNLPAVVALPRAR